MILNLQRETRHGHRPGGGRCAGAWSCGGSVDVHVDDTVRDYAVRLVHAPGRMPTWRWAPAARSLALFKTAQRWPRWRSELFIPDDGQRLALPVLVHRLIVRHRCALRGYTAARVLTDLLQATALDIGSLK